jgi:hypothetical protein
MSVRVYLRGASLVVVAGDKMTQHDDVKISNVSQETRQFVKLAGTIHGKLPSWDFKLSKPLQPKKAGVSGERKTDSPNC